MEIVMNDAKLAAIDAIKQNADEFCALSDEIWQYAELSLKEYKSAEAYCRVLEKLGFSVEREVCGINGILGQFRKRSSHYRDPR